MEARESLSQAQDRRASPDFQPQVTQSWTGVKGPEKASLLAVAASLPELSALQPARPGITGRSQHPPRQPRARASQNLPKLAAAARSPSGPKPAALANGPGARLGRRPGTLSVLPLQQLSLQPLRPLRPPGLCTCCPAASHGRTAAPNSPREASIPSITPLSSTALSGAVGPRVFVGCWLWPQVCVHTALVCSRRPLSVC